MVATTRMREPRRGQSDTSTANEWRNRSGHDHPRGAGGGGTVCLEPLGSGLGQGGGGHRPRRRRDLGCRPRPLPLTRTRIGGSGSWRSINAPASASSFAPRSRSISGGTREGASYARPRTPLPAQELLVVVDKLLSPRRGDSGVREDGERAEGGAALA